MSGLDELPELSPRQLQLMQKFYDTGGFTEARLRRVASILDDLDVRMARDAAAAPVRAAA